MEKFAFQNIPVASLKRSMRDLFVDLIDLNMEGTGKGSLKSLPTNYGYAFFWYGYLDKKALAKVFSSYVSKEKVKEIKKEKKQDSPQKLQDQISDFLFKIVREHPEVVGEGHVEVHLAILAPKLKHATVLDAASSLNKFSSKLEKLYSFTNQTLKKKTGKAVEEIQSSFEVIDYITQKEVSKFADEYFWDDECGYVELEHRRLGCEIQLRIHFKGDETLEQVRDRIDRVIRPLKTSVDPMFRFGKPYWPF